MIKVYKITKIYALIMPFILIYLFLAYPDICIAGALSGVKLCLDTIIPSILPFMIIVKYLIYSGTGLKISKYTDTFFEKIFCLPKNSSIAFISGCLSGYPMGAMVLSDLVNQKALSRENASLMLGYSNNASPVFVIATIGTVFLKSAKAGYILYAVNLISSFIVMYIFKNKYFSEINLKPSFNSYKSPFTKAVSDSGFTVVILCCYIIFFSVVIKFVLAFLGSIKLISIPICMIAEISTGAKILSELNIFLPLKYALISGCIAFSGLSVYFQVESVAQNSKIETSYYLKTKFLMALISFMLTFLVFSAIK